VCITKAHLNNTTKALCQNYFYNSQTTPSLSGFTLSTTNSRAREWHRRPVLGSVGRGRLCSGLQRWVEEELVSITLSTKKEEKMKKARARGGLSNEAEAPSSPARGSPVIIQTRARATKDTACQGAERNQTGYVP
jgi:hypothetical protein